MLLNQCKENIWYSEKNIDYINMGCDILYTAKKHNLNKYIIIEKLNMIKTIKKTTAYFNISESYLKKLLNYIQ